MYTFQRRLSFRRLYLSIFPSHNYEPVFNRTAIPHFKQVIPNERK